MVPSHLTLDNSHLTPRRTSHIPPQIVRSLTDASRYDMSSRIAACLGLDTRQDSSLWRDRAIVELGVAVLHSFKEAGMGACMNCCCSTALPLEIKFAWVRTRGMLCCCRATWVAW